MKQLVSFIVVVVVTAVTYWGVEPLAHSVMNPHVAPANFNFAEEDYEQAMAGLSAFQVKIDEATKSGEEAAITKAKKDYEYADAIVQENIRFWDEIKAIDLAKGDAAKGAELIQMAGCTGCHGLKAAGMENPNDYKTAASGMSVAPSDISNIAYLYDEKFLAALIKDPARALKVTHKFGDERPFEMPAFFGAGGNLDEEIAHIVAYLKSIAPKEMSNKEVFESACARCHDMKYDNVFAAGNKQEIKAYLGITPPDLSMYIRSRSIEYLHNFINDPQKMLDGTSMPRVGLNEPAQDQVIAYMQSVGDSKKEERERLGLWIMGYFLILGILAILWKNKVWRNLH